ncbi:MAG: DUF5360 family protein [Pseudomonadota bacterium]|jgi:hypothetical protein|nr:DUF5360 family protein [Pseudomonadota bacterium]
MIRRGLMLFTDIGMLLYWAITAAMALKLLDIPGDWLFKDYHDPRVMAWNWSFFPLDILLSVTGLAALRMESAGHPNWRIMAAISLTLTFCAGLMAIAYWLIVQDFDPNWWIPNLFLMLWPLPFLYRLMRQFDI